MTTNTIKIILFLLLPVTCVWSQMQLGIDLDGEDNNNSFGNSIDMSADGNRLVIGGPGNDNGGVFSGHTRVFSWDGNQWIQLGQDIDGEADFDSFGQNVAMSANGNRVAASAIFADSADGDNAGYTRIFEWDGSSWMQLGLPIYGEDPGDFSRNALDLSADGNRIAIGAESVNDIATQAGQVRVFEWNGSQWLQLGQNIDGDAFTDFMGADVSLSADGNRLVVGAPGNSAGLFDNGVVRVFDWNESNWQQIGQDIAGENTLDGFGRHISLSASGSHFAVGTIGNDDNGTSAGQVRVFELVGNSWLQVGEDIDGGEAGDCFGSSVAISDSGTRIVVGATTGFDGGINSPGYAEIYDWDGSTWSQTGDTIIGEALEDYFGDSIALSADGDRMAVGARRNDGNGTSSGHVRIYDVSSSTLTTNSNNPEKWVEIYPNPVSDKLFISIPQSQKHTQIQLFKSTGELIIDHKFSTPILELLMHHYPQGIYFLRIIKDRNVINKKILKN